MKQIDDAIECCRDALAALAQQDPEKEPDDEQYWEAVSLRNRANSACNQLWGPHVVNVEWAITTYHEALAKQVVPSRRALIWIDLAKAHLLLATASLPHC